MINHSCVVVSSEENAFHVFDKLLHLKRAYDFNINKEIMFSLFRVNTSAKAIIYDCGNAKMEVFIIPDLARYSQPVFHHICLDVPNRLEILEEAAKMNLEICRYQSEDRDVTFFVDNDGNRFEIKDSVV